MKLPFGLQVYAPGEFERVHAAGSGILTASLIPAIFGYSSFAGPYATAAHLLGSVALPSGDNPLAQRGRDLEVITAKKLRDAGYRMLRPRLGMYARHPRIANFLSTPDSLVWLPNQTDRRDLHEGKVVARGKFKREWADGPPLPVHLQHQGQYACCEGAERGLITALVIGEHVLELHRFPTERNPGAIKVIENAAEALLEKLARGELPEPDTHPTAAPVLQALHPYDDSKPAVTLTGTNFVQGIKMADKWKAAADARKKAEKEEKEAKAWFAAKALGAPRVLIGNERRVEVTQQFNKGYTVDPHSKTIMKLIEV
jgi:hypothetical protein